jgi:hypothetical protein
MMANFPSTTDDESRRFAQQRIALYSGTLAATCADRPSDFVNLGPSGPGRVRSGPSRRWDEGDGSLADVSGA